MAHSYSKLSGWCKSTSEHSSQGPTSPVAVCAMNRNLDVPVGTNVHHKWCLVKQPGSCLEVLSFTSVFLLWASRDHIGELLLPTYAPCGIDMITLFAACQYFVRPGSMRSTWACFHGDHDGALHFVAAYAPGQHFHSFEVQPASWVDRDWLGPLSMLSWSW